MSQAINYINARHAMNDLVRAACKLAFESGDVTPNPCPAGSEEFRIWSTEWHRLHVAALKPKAPAGPVIS